MRPTSDRDKTLQREDRDDAVGYQNGPQFFFVLAVHGGSRGTQQ